MNAYPAYGRKYKNRVEAVKDWIDGKDFIDERGFYFSIRDFDLLKEMGNTDIYIMYNNTMNGIARIPLQ